MDPADLMRVFESESGRNTILNLQVGDGDSSSVVIKDFQLDPVRGNLMHIDFQYVSLDQKMEFQVPVETVGVASGVKNSGGIMDLVLREIDVECLPTNVPDNIKIDVTELEIGDSLRISELEIDEELVSVLNDTDQVVVTVVAPRMEEEPEPEEELLEPELISEQPDEEEETAEEEE
jgi:large subunit ribosomal protein L25